MPIYILFIIVIVLLIGFSQVNDKHFMTRPFPLVDTEEDEWEELSSKREKTKRHPLQEDKQKGADNSHFKQESTAGKPSSRGRGAPTVPISRKKDLNPEEKGEFYTYPEPEGEASLRTRRFIGLLRQRRQEEEEENITKPSVKSITPLSILLSTREEREDTARIIEEDILIPTKIYPHSPLPNRQEKANELLSEEARQDAGLQEEKNISCNPSQTGTKALETEEELLNPSIYPSYASILRLEDVETTQSEEVDSLDSLSFPQIPRLPLIRNYQSEEN